MTDPSETYDDIPYESYAYPQSHPGNLATIATLFGMQPCPLDAARVLEIGCAGGGNLLPVAATYPGSRFVGIDLSARQIAGAQAGADAFGLRNVELHAMGLEDMYATFGTFDYIIAHGVYSWVAAPVREKLMSQCARLLNPQGIAYISFNALPGSRIRAGLCDMAKYHTRRASGLSARTTEARAFFAFLESALQDRDDTGSLSLRKELSEVAGLSDFYIAHEYLEGINAPCYFHEFIDHARGHGLQYLGDAEIQTMSTGDFPASVRNSLRAMAANIEEAEQYNDFIRHRAFRQTLLCRDSVALKRAISPDKVQRLHFASSLCPVSEDASLRQFLDADGVTFEIADPLARAALLELLSAWPASLGFDTLLEKASQRAGVPANPRQSATLANALLTCYSATRAMEFHLHPPVFCTRLSEFPAAPPFVRWQAAHGSLVTSMRHENVLLSPPEKALLPQLDGTRSLSSLEQEFEDARPLLEYFARIALLIS